jgi:molybdate transport system substrate-binding protein
MRLMRIGLAVLAIGLSGLIVPLRAADEAAVTVLCSNGLKAVAEDLIPKFERTTKQTVTVRYGLAAALKQQIEHGDPFDVAFLTPAAMDDLIKSGKIAVDSRNAVARSGLGVAIRAGARKPDIKTLDTFKRALLDAKGLAYAKEGASGVAFSALIDRLGIAAALKPKSRLTATGEEVGEAIVKGDVEFGILPISEILPVKGVELLGPFPAEAQSYIVMVGGTSATTKQAKASKELLDFFMAPAANPVLTAKGMEREPGQRAVASKTR